MQILSLGKTFGDSFSSYDYEGYEYEDEIAILTTTTQHPNSVLPAKPEMKIEMATKPTTDFNELPEFAETPQNAFVIRAKSAQLRCVVTKANKAYFTCNDEAMAESKLHKEKDTVDLDGNVVKIVTLEVRRSDVEEIFGTFSCTCDAWSKKGKVSSNAATVETACE